MGAKNSTIANSATKIEALRFQSSAYGVPVTLAWGRNRLAGNLLYYTDFVAIPHTSTQTQGGKGGGGKVTTQTTTYTYAAALMMALGEGVITDIPTIWKGKKKYITDGSGTAYAKLGLSFATGAIGQAVWSFLTSSHAAQAVPYSGIAHVRSVSYDLGDQASVENHSFEVIAKYSGVVLSGTTAQPDADPSQVVLDALTSAQYGAGFPAAKMGDLTAYSSYCRAANFLLSPIIDTQISAAEFLKSLAQISNTGLVWSGALLKFVPYGDTAVTANNTTYTPSNSPVYDLTDDDFLSNGEDPVKQTRTPNADAYNNVQVEFVNRANDYNVEVAEAKDQANIDAFGLRTATPVKAHWICDASIARNISQVLMQRGLYIRNLFEFRLSLKYSLLEPMDIVTLTDAGLGLNRYPVRITRIEENEGYFVCTAEDFPIGVAAAAIYPSQSGAGFSHQYNAAPGSIVTPAFFEPPVEQTTTGLEVWAAVSGPVGSTTWGGCTVWVSLDGNTYKQLNKVFGGSRYGTLSGNESGGNIPITLAGIGGQILAGTAADAATALNTLCLVGDEYLSHAAAALTGANAYTLGGLVRSQYTSPQVTHVAGERFIRVDQAIAKSDPLDLSFIGKTLYFKFTSFNVYGGGEQGLADVPAYTYLVRGFMAALPPSAPTGVTYSLEPFGVRLKCNKNPEPDVTTYEWRAGSTWAGAVVLDAAGGTSFLWAVQTSGTLTAWVAAKDGLGNYSTPVSTAVVVPGPTVTSITAAIAGINLLLDWVGVIGAFAIAGYEVRMGNTYATATVLGIFQLSHLTQAVNWGGSQRFWITAIDVKGTYGANSFIDTVVTVPGAVTSSRAEVIDNNVLLYWNPPATGSLPIAYYAVTKGATFAASVAVGSNGNSTFAAIFEQASGTYTYWIVAYDSAGNASAPVGITATVNQPPDYILRTTINSTFSGTLTNFFLDGFGNLIGPVNTAQTWSAHFSGNAWASPADQVAAGLPIYIEPSLASGSYVEAFDYGTVLAATTVTATLGTVPIAGTVSVACQIAYKLLVGDPWTNAAPGSSVLITNFRYVQVTYTFTGAAGANVLKVTSFNLKLANKLKTDSGAGTAPVGGVTINFNVPFVSADTPLVQPNGATPLVPVVIYVGGANPTSFTVKIYNQSGTEVGGSFSWTARGY